MSDGLNDARAMRIAEVLEQYRSFQSRIAACRVTAPPSQAQARGYVILRQLHQQAQALLAQPFNTSALVSVKDDDNTKRLLQRVLLDATARRFKAYKIASRATAVMRWVNRRAQVLHGSSPGAQHASALAQIDSTLNTEIAGLTDQKLYHELHAKDVAAGNWVAEMASFPALMSYIQAN